MNLRIEPADGITVVTLDRPPVNAMSLEFVHEIADAAERLRDAAEPPAAVLLAGSERAFSAGLDLRALPTLDTADQRSLVAGLNRMFCEWYALQFPVVGAITGHAIAGGMLLALCADVRIGSDAGRYGITELQVGVPFPVAAMGLVRGELSPSAGRRLALRADVVDAAEALRLGVLDEVLAAGQVRERALALAHELATLPPPAYAATKQALRGDVIAAMRRAMSDDPCLEAWVPDDIVARAAARVSGR